jgi:predicted ATP-grasp superfamily ATP-dependent carboligase
VNHSVSPTICRTAGHISRGDTIAVDGRRRTALIVGDAFNRSALAGVRDLARAGWAVGLGTQADGGFAAGSRYVAHRHHVPLAETGVDAVVEAVNRAVDEVGYDLLFAVGDAESLTLSLARERLKAPVAFPPHAAMLACFDKLALNQRAAESGVAVPRTLVATKESLAETAYPVVVKAGTHWIGGAVGRQSRFPVVRADDRATAERAVTALHADGVQALLQEIVAGQLVALVVVLDRDGGLVAVQQQEAQSVWPVGSGVSTRAVTVPVDRSLCDGVVTMLRKAGWWGLAELQFLVGADGRPALIDFNGRFYGSMALAGAAGLNLPDLWARVALDEPVPSGLTARAGVAYQWFEGDLRRAAAGSRRVRELTRCVLALPRSAHSVWSTRDPGPAVRHLAVLGCRAARKVRGRR